MRAKTLGRNERVFRRTLSVLLLSTAVPALAQLAPKWFVDRSPNGQACHVRPANEEPVDEAPVRGVAVNSRSEACRQAAELAKDANEPCMFFSNQSLMNCNDSAKNLMWTEVRPDVVVEQITMQRLRADVPHVYRLPFDKAPLMEGGDAVLAGAFPATLVFRSPAGKACTAMLVGPRVLLTAEHCVSDIELSYKAELVVSDEVKKFSKLKCHKNPDVDLAICEPEKPDDKFTSDHFEKVSTDAPGSTVYIAGFSDGNDPKRQPLFLGGTFTITALLTDALTMEAKTSGASPTEGDSGAGAFNQCPSPRKLLGIQERAQTGFAYITRFSSAMVRDQLNSWASPTRVICGLSASSECVHKANICCTKPCPVLK